MNVPCPALTVPLPPYEPPRNAWREQIHHAVSLQMRATRTVYGDGDQLSVEVQLFMTESMLRFHDVDNRLKDILDALQGRAGGPKKTRRLAPLIPNDKQIFRASIEKQLVPPDRQLGGQLTIRWLNGDSWGAA